MFIKNKKLNAFMLFETLVACCIISVISIELFTLYVNTNKNIQECNEWLTFFRESKEGRTYQMTTNYQGIQIEWQRNGDGTLAKINCQKNEKKTQVHLQQATIQK